MQPCGTEQGRLAVTKAVPDKGGDGDVGGRSRKRDPGLAAALPGGVVPAEGRQREIDDFNPGHTALQ